MILISGTLLLLLTACSDGGYYLQAAQGQYEILKKRQPIQELLSSGTLTQKQQLELSRILEIRDFASQKLALPDNGSYRSYVALETPYPIWNVVAAPELSLQAKTWCFPIAGCVSYRGYFSEASAIDFAQDLQKQSYDTLVAGIPAYSTLSWFDDPVLSSFSSWPTPSVARLIFHELAHQQLYLPDDSAFSEAFATSVELAGVKHWLRSSGSSEETALFNQQLEREATFVEWTSVLHQRLADLYSSALSPTAMRQQKRDIITEAKNSYQQLKESWGGYSGYDKWVSSLNNARLVSIRTYRSLLPAFDALLKENNGDFPAFYLACKTLAAKPFEQRQQILNQLLEVPQIASQQEQ